MTYTAYGVCTQHTTGGPASFLRTTALVHTVDNLDGYADSCHAAARLVRKIRQTLDHRKVNAAAVVLRVTRVIV